MPLTPMPAAIELTDFSAGVVPKAEEVGVPPNALLGSMNVLLDGVTGSVVTRKGTARLLGTGDGTNLNGYRLMSINPYTRGKGNRYLICVYSSGTAAASNNIKIYAYVLSDSENLHAGATFFRIDTNNRAWNSANGRHWGAAIDGVYYGGGEGDKMYSWDPSRATPWNADPGTPAYPAWRESGTTDLANNRNRDYAFKENDAVLHTYTKDGNTITEAFSAKEDLRYDKWDADVKRYKKGDRVTTTYDWEGKGAYWRCWEATEGHEPAEANKPGSSPGAGKGVWKRVRLMRPVDDDGNMNAKHWDRVPDAPQTHIAFWHGNRLMARNDKGIGGKQTLVYSRLAKVSDKDNIGKDRIGKAGDPQWDPDDWRAGGEDGAGFIPFETKEGDNIEAGASFGYYALIFKRHSTHVIAGRNPATWTIRQLADVGAVYSRAVAEYEGWLYFMSDRGFWRTDGTQAVPVPGSDKIDGWLRDAVNWDAELKDIELRAFDGKIWITLPTNNSGGYNNLVMLYDPATESFWPLDLKVQTMAVARRNGRDQLFFATPNQAGVTTFAAYAWTGTKTGSSSTRTVNGVTTTNYLTNPTFRPLAGQWSNPINWASTHENIKVRTSKAAARSGTYGVEIENHRNGGDLDYANYGGIVTNAYNAPAGTYVVQFSIRRANWIKKPKVRPRVRFRIRGVDSDISGSKYLGEGWFRVWKVTTLEGADEVGLVIPPGTGATTQVDEAIATPAGVGPVMYFDGDGGDIVGEANVAGDQKPYIMQYDHEDAEDLDGNYVDLFDPVTEAQPVNWFARTAWLTFGAMQEERRIRRLWALVRANTADVGIRTFRNFSSHADEGNIEAVTPGVGVVYNEGELPDDCHSIQVEVEGTNAPAALLGVALDTEPRRIRFGRR